MATDADIWFIRGSQDLAELRANLRSCAWIALDTEFERQRTYFAELCLIQIATPELFACLDPLELDDLGDLFAAFALPQTKVLHAARQDLEIFFNLSGEVPAPVFDTQIAAALTGHPEQIGYADLVGKLCAVTLDKTQSRTDWKQRPLTPAQIDYAVADVSYLSRLKDVLEQDLDRLGRREWLDEECSMLRDPELYSPSPENAWRRLKGISKISETAFSLAAALAAWREKTAVERNLPRAWVLKDATLIALATRPPNDRHELAGTFGVSPATVRRHGAEMLALLSAPGIHTSAAQPPDRVFTAAGKAMLKTLSQLVYERAAALNIASAVLATRRDLERAIFNHGELRIYCGWRAGVIGAEVRERLAQAAEPLCS